MFKGTNGLRRGEPFSDQQDHTQPINDAGGGNRTLTLLPGRDFESRASANSATPAVRPRIVGSGVEVVKGSLAGRHDHFCEWNDQRGTLLTEQWHTATRLTVQSGWTSNQPLVGAVVVKRYL